MANRARVQPALARGRGGGGGGGGSGVGGGRAGGQGLHLGQVGLAELRPVQLQLHLSPSGQGGEGGRATMSQMRASVWGTL